MTFFHEDHVKLTITFNSSFSLRMLIRSRVWIQKIWELLKHTSLQKKKLYVHKKLHTHYMEYKNFLEMHISCIFTIKKLNVKLKVVSDTQFTYGILK